MTCDEARVAAMALDEGETPAFPRVEVERHVAGCVPCRQELAELAALEGIWNSHARDLQKVDLWPAIELRLVRRRRRWWAALAAALVIFRCVELFPDRTLTLWTQVVPLGAAIVVFVILRLNPFQISTELQLSQEEP